MTTWHSGHGWGWCTLMVNIPAPVLLWGAVVTAMVLAIRRVVVQPSDPPAPTGTGYSRPKAAAAQIARNETHDDEFYRRLM